MLHPAEKALDRGLKFKDHMGLPLRRYLLWARLLQGIKLIKRGMNLTDMAHETGFSDSAHFSRTFKENFGYSPSTFFYDIQNYEILDCTDRTC